MFLDKVKTSQFQGRNLVASESIFLSNGELMPIEIFPQKYKIQPIIVEDNNNLTKLT